MKYIFILAISVLYLHAETAKMTQSEYKSIHHHNNKAVLKIREKSNMHRIHKVDEEQAKVIVRDLTHEKVIKLKLTNRNRILYFSALTQHYHVEVNAMDGTILKKEKR